MCKVDTMSCNPGLYCKRRKCKEGQWWGRAWESSLMGHLWGQAQNMRKEEPDEDQAYQVMELRAVVASESRTMDWLTSKGTFRVCEPCALRPTGSLPWEQSRVRDPSREQWTWKKYYVPLLPSPLQGNSLSRLWKSALDFKPEIFVFEVSHTQHLKLHAKLGVHPYILRR